jgi:pimeloyl-ACP methyl ester carboxylesterase
MKTVLYLLGTAAALYVGLVVLVFLVQDRLLFFTPGVHPVVRSDLAELSTSFEHDGTVLRGWYLERPEADHLPVLVYYGGNAEEVSGNLMEFAQLPVGGVLLVNYRGYGDSDGRPSADALISDAVFILDEFTGRTGIDPARVVLMGRSLGSGVASAVASRRNIAGLILVTPFDRLSRVAGHHYPFLPVRWLMRHEMDSSARAADISAPSVVIYAELDAIIPPKFARSLHADLPEPKQLVSVPDADHNTIGTSPAYWRSIEVFLESITPTT